MNLEAYVSSNVTKVKSDGTVLKLRQTDIDVQTRESYIPNLDYQNAVELDEHESMFEQEFVYPEKSNIKPEKSKKKGGGCFGCFKKSKNKKQKQKAKRNKKNKKQKNKEMK